MIDVRHLKNLPDGLFICGEGIFQVIDGVVIKLEAAEMPLDCPFNAVNNELE